MLSKKCVHLLAHCKCVTIYVLASTSTFYWAQEIRLWEKKPGGLLSNKSFVKMHLMNENKGGMVSLLCAQASEHDSVLAMLGTANCWLGFTALAAVCLPSWEMTSKVSSNQYAAAFWSCTPFLIINSNFCLAIIAKDDQKKRALWE